MSEEEVKQRLRAWLVERAREPQVGTIADDYDLILHRAVDSLRFVEFVLFVEELSGRRIEPEAVRLDDFRTLDEIWRCWFARSTHDAA